MDIIIFSGQSNMQGQTESFPTVNPVIENAYEYRLKEDAILPLQHPVGEDLFNDAMLGSHLQRGSLLPAFCKAYVQATGNKVLAVHTAKGATTVGEWLRGTQRFHYAIIKMKSAIQKLLSTGETLGKIYFVWLQGESDALIQTTEEEYLQRLKQFKDDLKKEITIEKFAIIKVGYFASEATWLRAQKERWIEWDEAIQNAQERAVKEDTDFVMLTRICPNLSKDADFINPEACGHYNNSAMEIIGTEAGNTLANLSH
jgi:hypothetical protein